MVRSWIGILALVLLALLLGCVVGLVFLWIRVLRNPGGSEPTCGKCGYAVQGLSALTCPECGSDFRAVGIDTPKQRGAVGPAVFVTLWTLLLPMPALVAIGIAVAMGPRQTVSQQNLTLTPIASSGYQDIDLYDAGFSGPWNTASSTTHLNVTLNPSGGAGTWAYMEVDLTAFTHEDFNAMTAPAPLDEQAVLAWMGNAGLSTTDPDIQNQAKELFGILQRAQTQGLQGATATHFTVSSSNWSYDQPVWWFFWLQVALWVLIWIAGILWYLRIRRKRRRQWSQHAAEAASTAVPVPPSPPSPQPAEV